MTDLIQRLHDLLLQATTERSHYYVAQCCRDSIAVLEAQQKEIERLRKDAERYRFLRERACISIMQMWGDSEAGFRRTFEAEQAALDAHIDAAMVKP